MKLYIVPETGVSIKENVTNYFEMDYKNFIDLVFGQSFNNVSIVSEKQESDLLICGIQTLETTPLDKKTMLVCVENCSAKGRPHYKHFNLFQHYNDSRISIFIYNDISKIVKGNNFIAIPFIYLYIDQFVRLEKTLTVPKVSFADKKFCLIASRNNLNRNKGETLHLLSNIDCIDLMGKYEELKSTSCYHSQELLSVFSQYKFIICFENSKNDGYITEKLFNVFLAGSIPVYDGAPNLDDFINPAAILNYQDPKFLKKLSLLNTNEKLYEITLRLPKISKNYYNENWSQELQKFLE